MKCYICNSDVKETDEFCNNCGAKIQEAESDKQEVVNIEENSKKNICDNCGHEYKETDKFCNKCGKRISRGESDIPQALLHCHICNSPINIDDRFCNNCGAKLKDNGSKIQMVEPTRDIIAERFNYNYQQKAPKSVLALWLSIGAVGLSFILSGLIPYITLAFGIGALGFAIFKLVKDKSRISAWAIAVSILALMMSTLSIVSNLIAKDYAYESADRISKIVDVDLPDIEPSFYDIAIIDREVVKIGLFEFDFNDIIYEINEDEAVDFVTMIEHNNNFKSNDLIKIHEEFSGVMLDGTDIALVYNLKTKTYGLPEDLENYELIIINYDYDSMTIQILEVSSKTVA